MSGDSREALLAATRLQAHWRRYTAQKEYKKTLRAIIRIQAHIKGRTNDSKAK
eukprot:m.38902 g.38902  ORF g.38902 m.38902 type:complete len:53 (-) comp11539_c0_seq1:316-474(-)